MRSTHLPICSSAHIVETSMVATPVRVKAENCLTGIVARIDTTITSWMAWNDVHTAITPKSGEPFSSDGCLPRKIQPPSRRPSNDMLRHPHSVQPPTQGVCPSPESIVKQENTVSADPTENNRNHGQRPYQAQRQRVDWSVGQRGADGWL